MKTRNILLALFVFAAVFAFSPAAAFADDFPIGSKLDDFKLSATDGKTYSFSELKGEKGTVLVFLSAQCPVVKSYVDRINSLAADYKAKGINFVGINSNATEDLAWVTSHRNESFPELTVLIDTGNVIADKLGANFTPETYFFDAENTLLYHGSIDDDRSGENATETYLKNAFDLTLAGKKVEKTTNRAFGCSIKRKDA
jgi:peroxiredoxin